MVSTNRATAGCSTSQRTSMSVLRAITSSLCLSATETDEVDHISRALTHRCVHAQLHVQGIGVRISHGRSLALWSSMIASASDSPAWPRCASSSGFSAS